MNLQQSTQAWPYRHRAMLLQYSGISFFSGAINHGFFSAERSFWAALIGCVVFVLGTWMSHRTQPQATNLRSLKSTLAWGTLLSIGLGLFTGGLQHFPDSPARSSWVVPLGFILSALALALPERDAQPSSHLRYVLVSTAAMTLLSVGIWQALAHHPDFGSPIRHAHDDTLTEHPLTALKIDRTLTVSMDDRMRYTPDTLDLVAGETVRLVVHNVGQSAHEWVMGSPTDLAEHAKDMVAHAHHHHEAMPHATSLTVAPGQTGELILRFQKAATYQVGCLLPGHYEAGMKGQVMVHANSTQSRVAATPTPL